MSLRVCLRGSISGILSSGSNEIDLLYVELEISIVITALSAQPGHPIRSGRELNLSTSNDLVKDSNIS